MTPRYPPKAWLLLFLLSLIWGSSFMLIKKGLTVLNPLEVGSLRMFTAAIFLLPFSLSRLKKVNKRQIRYLVAVGLSGSFIPSFLFAIAQTRIESAITGILNALTPLFTVLIGVLIFSQKQSMQVYLGILIGLTGTVFLMAADSGGQLDQFNFYAFFIVLATIMYATNSNLIKYKLHDLKSLTITSLALLIVAPFSIAILFFLTDFTTKLQYTEGTWMAVFYISILGVAGTAIALIIFNKIVQLTDPVFTSSVTYIIPIVAVVWGLLDGEKLLPADLIGMGCILIGIYVTNRSPKAKAHHIKPL